MEIRVKESRGLIIKALQLCCELTLYPEGGRVLISFHHDVPGGRWTACISLCSNEEHIWDRIGWSAQFGGKYAARIQVLKHQGWRSKFKMQETGFHSVGLSLRG